MQKTASRLIAAGVTAAILTLGLTASAVTTASTALAAPTCHETSCVGHDPVTYGCTISNEKEYGDSYATVWGDFSNNCDAKWARGQLTPQSVSNHYTMNVVIYTDDNSQLSCVIGPSNTGDWKEYCTAHDSAPTIAYTDMVDGHKNATAYVYVYGPTGHQIHQISLPVQFP